MRRLILPLLLLMGWTATAAAHELAIERSLTIQLHASHAELLLIYSEPPGPRTDRILALYDSDKDGRISGVEARLARRPMLRRAQLGLDVSVNGANTAEKQPQVRFRRDESGGIAMATYQRIDFIAQADAISIDVKLGDVKGTPELQLEVESGADWHFPGDDAGRRVTLRPGKTASFAVERTVPEVTTDDSKRRWQPPEKSRLK